MFGGRCFFHCTFQNLTGYRLVLSDLITNSKIDATKDLHFNSGMYTKYNSIILSSVSPVKATLAPSMACESRLNEVVYPSDPFLFLIVESKPWSALK